MNENIRKILDDLYAIDPQLRGKEPELIKIIESLLQARPSVAIDDNFRLNLKNQILEKFANQKTNNNFMQKFIYAIGGAVVVVVLLVAVYLYQTPTKISQFNPLQPNKIADLDLSFEVTKVDDQAFGTLRLAGTAVGDQQASGEAAAPAGAGFGGGGGMGVAPAMPSRMDIGIMPPYNPVSYRYVYRGDDFTVDNEQMAVYKKQNNFVSANSNLSNLNLGLIDLQSFADTKLQNFTLMQDQEFGYMIYVDMYEGMVFVSENWTKWYGPNEVDSYQGLRPEEIPADDTLIALADRFLADHDVNLGSYGPGEVDNSWRLYYDQAPDKANYYISPTVTVLYPQIIDQRTVYDQGGLKDGLRVGVNVRKNRVGSAYNISALKYLSSNYPVETDKDKILALAQQGGLYPDYSDPAATVVEVELGTPTLVYIKSWSYKENRNEEVLSPALIFPITKAPAPDEFNYFWRQNIVVPLVKEFFDQPQPIPMPLIEDKVLPETDPAPAPEPSPTPAPINY